MSITVSSTLVKQYSVSFSKESFLLKAGETQPLPDCSLQLGLEESWFAQTIPLQPTWSSSDEAVASVSNGQINAWKAGQSKLKALIHGQTIELPVTVTASETEPTTAPATDPTSASTTEPATDPVTQPVTDPVTALTTQPVTEPTTAPNTEPATVPTTAPTVAPSTEPSTESTTEPVTAPTTAPTTEPVTAPTTAPTTEPITVPTTQPATNPGPDSGSQPTTHTHALEILAPVTPTCLTTGLSAGIICSTCGEVIEPQKTLPMSTHSFTTIKTPAKYHKNGSIVQSCAVCGMRKTTKIPRIETIRLSAKTFSFNGKRQTPKVIVTDQKGKILKKNTDYTLTYSEGRKRVGTYQIKIKFIGNYKGSKTLKYKILPGEATDLRASALVKSAELQWTAAPGATHYVVYYSQTKRKGYQKLGKTTKTKATMVQLKSGATYYFRIRPITLRDDQQWNGALTKPVKVIAK